MGYSVFTGIKNGLMAQLTDFVPMGSTCEINKLTLKNTSDKKKVFSVFSYVEFCLWNAMDDMTNFQRNFSTGEVEIHAGAPSSSTRQNTENAAITMLYML